MEEVIHQHADQPEDEHIYSGDLLDTKTGHLDDLLNEKLEQALHKPTSQVMLHELAKIASEYDPIDLAHVSTRFPPSARPVIYENLPDLNAKIIFMINAGSNTRTAIFRTLVESEIVELIERMPPDEAVEMLDDVSDRRLRKIFELLDSKKAHRIRELQKHDRHSAGRLMTNEFFAFHLNASIGEVAAQIRDNPGIDLTRRIFVLNDLGELCGFIPSRNLIINPPEVPIRQIMRPILHKVTANVSRDEVVDLMERYSIPALPVVDQEDRPIGVIAYEDAVEALKDIHDETIANIAGTAEGIGERDDPILKRFLLRAPWLVVTVCAGLVTATAMSHFKDHSWYIFVPFFVTLITGMSGNVGIQCSTLLVRSISAGELTVGNRREAIRNELLIGLVIAVVFGIACGLIVHFLNHFGILLIGPNSFAVSTIVSSGVMVACLTATCLGTFSPLFFARLQIDPAVASGPTVNAFNDVLSTLMFFLAASVLSQFFL